MRTNSNNQRPALAIRLVKACVLASTVSLLAACGGKVDRLATQSSTIPFDYQKRHPIVMTSQPAVVNVFPTAGGLTRSDRSRLTDLAKRYKELGRGAIYIHFPANDRQDRRVINTIRQVMASNGVRGRMRVGSYPVLDNERASPVRVSFKALTAAVASRCGEWPDDLASASSLSGWNNKPYWNLGCAYQNMIAVQVADPRDLAGPRGESPSDIAMRMRAIDKVREGKDPSTDWKVKNSSIGTVGGQ
jgi:pilus assembly protein CpaD